ncbi:MAG TPA: GNAT family N-acetyltransferase [Phototrophicaceae bacterium]|nr:GNAT family N-acetyltransferase [Phototrophicaceae bacterium]
MDWTQDLSLIQTIEEYSFRAWAALETEIYDGWVLRFANGYTGRSNSINPIYSSTLDLETKLAYCINWYASRGVTHRFRLNDAMQPPELDRYLEEKGYTIYGSSSVMIMTADLNAVNLVQPVTGVKPVAGVTVQLEPERSDTWLTNFCRLHPTHAPHLDAMKAIMDRMPPTKYFTSVIADGEVVAMGLGIQDGAYIGLFDVITREDQRGKGYATQLVNGIVSHAIQNGVQTAYLQVMSENDPALKVYRRVGFHPIYNYWYRIPPEQSE